MSDWWLLIVVFWGLYLLDGLLTGKRLRHAAGPGATGWGRSVHFAKIHLVPPWPWAWQILALDPQASFSPEGISNVPVGSAGRPGELAPPVRAYRWEEISSITGDATVVHINGSLFCAATPLIDGAIIGRLRETMLATPMGQREEVLHRELASWFRVNRVRRQLRAWLLCTRPVALYNTVAALVWLALTVYGACHLALLLDEDTVTRINRHLPPVLAFVAALHLMGLVAAFLIRRKAPGGARGMSISQWISAVAIPAQALRLRHLLAGHWQATAHPLALALATGASDDARGIAFNVVSDLHWPSPPRATLPAQAAEIRDWQALQLRKITAAVLESEGITASQLLAPPRRDSASSCAYCPRCRDQFVRRDCVCPKGVDLLPLDGS